MLTLEKCFGEATETRLIDADALNDALMKKLDELMDIKEPCMSGTVAGTIGIVAQQTTIEMSDIINAVNFGAYEEVKKARQLMENWKYEAQCEHDIAVGFIQETETLKHKIDHLKSGIDKYCGEITKKYIYEYVAQLECDAQMSTK